MNKKTVALLFFTIVILSIMILSTLLISQKDFRIERRTIHDQCESIDMNPQVRTYLINGQFQARDMNLYEITCSYITYPKPIEGSDVRFITWYTIHLIGNESYITIPCYNDDYCGNPLAPPSTPETIYVLPDEPAVR